MIDKLLDLLEKLAKLNFIGELIGRGIISSSEGRIIESGINSAEISLIMYVMQALSTWVRSDFRLALYTFFTTIACWILSSYLMHLRQKKRDQEELLTKIEWTT